MTIAQIQIRRGTAAQWTSANPILADGEWGLETDTGKVKLGMGGVAWNSLAYFPSYIQTQIDTLGPRDIIFNTTPGTYSGAGGFVKGTYPWLKYIVVHVWGGGGGSGGCITAGASQSTAGYGGAGGGYAREILVASTLANQETYIVGAGGVAGASSGAQAGAGGTSSFGTAPYLSATGGDGGFGGTGVTTGTLVGSGATVSGGSGSGGMVNLNGEWGGPSWRLSGTGAGGSGGAAGGGGAKGRPVNNGDAAGITGNAPGGGASGSGNSASSSAKNGATGGAGGVLIELYG